jgi:hypothetical protein
METIVTIIKKKIATGLVACASVLAIATARFERDQQSCGMIVVQLKKKKQSIINRRSLGKLAFIYTALQLMLLSPSAAKQAENIANNHTQLEDPFNHIKQVKAGILNVGYVEAGQANGDVVLLLHGWPYDIYSYKEVSKILAAKGYRVLIPYLRGFGSTRFLSAATPRNGQQSALAVDMIAFLDALKVKDAIVGGFDWGARTADIMAALWPERVKGLVSVSGYLIGSQAANKAPLKPHARQAWW